MNVSGSRTNVIVVSSRGSAHNSGGTTAIRSSRRKLRVSQHAQFSQRRILSYGAVAVFIMGGMTNVSGSIAKGVLK